MEISKSLLIFLIAIGAYSACATSSVCAANFILCFLMKPTTNSATTAIAAITCAVIVSTYGYKPIQSLVGTLLK